MGKKSKKDTEDAALVYTTKIEGNPFFNDILLDSEEDSTIDKNQMVVRVRRDRKQRGGKEVTLVEGLELNEEALQALGKTLKKKCGTGGSAKDGIILIQGNVVDKVIDLLKKEGYTNTKKSGG